MLTGESLPIEKGEGDFGAGIPESIHVLVKEILALGLNLGLLDGDQEI